MQIYFQGSTSYKTHKNHLEINLKKKILFKTSHKHFTMGLSAYWNTKRNGLLLHLNVKETLVIHKEA